MRPGQEPHHVQQPRRSSVGDDRDIQIEPIDMLQGKFRHFTGDLEVDDD